MTSRNSDKVKPLACEFIKLAASLKSDCVCPKGVSKTRFSTIPSAVTRTAKARSSERLTNSICLIGASVFGAKTKLAPFVNLDKTVPVLFKIFDKLFGSSLILQSIISCSSSEILPTSKRVSTNNRSPF